MLALDHGISMGPIEGIADPVAALTAGAKGGATCVTLHKGLVPLAAPFADRLGVMLHLSASTTRAPDPDDKRLVATVEEAVRLGCDGVSIHVNVGAMMYPRGPKVKQPAETDAVAHAARLGAELGADAVKVPSCAAFRDVVQGCPVPVLVAGGATRSLETLLAELGAARKAGAQGVSVGRNVFQQPDPAAAMAKIAKVFA